MSDYSSEIRETFKGGLRRLICSNPAGKAEPYRRIVYVRKNNGFQQESYTEKQVFHKNLTPDEAAESVLALFGEHMRQLNLEIDEDGMTVSVEYKMSKGGKIFTTRKKDNAAVKEQPLSHNRAKNYLITEGSDVPPLVDMGIFMTPAYDLLNAALVNPDDQEELALTLNARKKKIKKTDFVQAMQKADIPEKVITNIFKRFLHKVPEWLETIQQSFLPKDYQVAYRQMVCDRLARLEQ